MSNFKNFKVDRKANTASFEYWGKINDIEGLRGSNKGLRIRRLTAKGCFLFEFDYIPVGFNNIVYKNETTDK